MTERQMEQYRLLVRQIQAVSANTNANTEALLDLYATQFFLLYQEIGISGGGGGFSINPNPMQNGVNRFYGSTKSDAQNTRDSYFSANPDILAEYDVDPLRLIQLAWGVGVTYMFEFNSRDQSQWFSTFSQAGSDIDLSMHSVTELNDVTSAGSGEIITVDERQKLTNLPTDLVESISRSTSRLLVNYSESPQGQVFLQDLSRVITLTGNNPSAPTGGIASAVVDLNGASGTFDVTSAANPRSGEVYLLDNSLGSVDFVIIVSASSHNFWNGESSYMLKAGTSVKFQHIIEQAGSGQYIVRPLGIYNSMSEENVRTSWTEIDPNSDAYLQNIPSSRIISGPTNFLTEQELREIHKSILYVGDGEDITLGDAGLLGCNFTVRLGTGDSQMQILSGPSVSVQGYSTVLPGDVVYVFFNPNFNIWQCTLIGNIDWVNKEFTQEEKDKLESLQNNGLQYEEISTTNFVTLSQDSIGYPAFLNFTTIVNNGEINLDNVPEGVFYFVTHNRENFVDNLVVTIQPNSGFTLNSGTDPIVLERLETGILIKDTATNWFYYSITAKEKVKRLYELNEDTNNFSDSYKLDLDVLKAPLELINTPQVYDTDEKMLGLANKILLCNPGVSITLSACSRPITFYIVANLGAETFISVIGGSFFLEGVDFLISGDWCKVFVNVEEGIFHSAFMGNYFLSHFSVYNVSTFQKAIDVEEFTTDVITSYIVDLIEGDTHTDNFDYSTDGFNVFGLDLKIQNQAGEMLINVLNDHITHGAVFRVDVRERTINDLNIEIFLDITNGYRFSETGTNSIVLKAGSGIYEFYCYYENPFEEPSASNIVTITTADITPNLSSAINEAGQIRADYPDLSLIGFDDEVRQYFDIDSATPTVSSVTKYPNSAENKDYSDLFADNRSTGNPASLIGKLIENPVDLSAQTWRIIGQYSNKAANANIGLEISLENPVSGFLISQTITLPSGITSGSFSALLTTIADSVSIPFPQGYVLSALTTVSDANLVISIDSITRISNSGF